MQLLNPRNPDQAIAWAKTLITGKNTGLSGLCDHFVALAYGWGHSGDAYARKTWNNHIEQHIGDKNPPAGALVVWTRKQPPNMGHIALSAGNGMIISTDVPDSGQVGCVPLAWFSKNWPSFQYLGWIQPMFKAPAAPISRPMYPAHV
jgi:hypothetical protein